MDPVTRESRCYGFVWFENELSAMKVIQESNDKVIPFSCCLYRPRLFSDLQNREMQTITIKGLPSFFTNDDLYTLFDGFGKILFHDFFNSFQTNERLGIVKF